MTTGLIETTDHGDIREIRLARAPVNALNTELCRALIDALNAALDQGARGIVLAGNPRIFSAGMDVPYLLSLGDNRQIVGFVGPRGVLNGVLDVFMPQTTGSGN